MWGRRQATLDRIAQDQGLRDHAVTALDSADRARQKLFPDRSKTALALRLAEDGELRDEIKQLAGELRGAAARLQDTRSHRVRNLFLLILAAAAAMLVPAVRRRFFGGGGDDWATE